VAEQALREKTKDFEIAAWLAEALARTDGLAGVADGAALLAGLLDRYWESGFPRPDEDGLEGRAAPLGGLSGAEADGTLLWPLRRTPLFRRADGSMLLLYQYEQAQETAGLADEAKREARWRAGIAKLDQLEAEARLDVARLRGTAAAARAARAAWAAFEAKLAERFGRDAPSTRRVAEVLERIASAAETLAGGPLPEPAAADPQAAGAEVAASGVAPGPAATVPAGAIASREEALRQLERLAEFFRRTEPHSPLAYTLEEAVRRGRMTLPELLEEVLGDESARTAMLTALGIRPQSAR
jgi:type VI secretion system protein ImpA